MSYDPHCEELARLFLDPLDNDDAPPSEQRVQQLAERIQDTIEAFIDGESDVDDAD